MIQLLFVSIIVAISIFYNTMFVLVKTRKRLKSVTEDTKYREYASIFIIGFIVNLVLLVTSTSIALDYGIEWEWFGGTAMLAVYPTIPISIIPINLVRKPIIKYKPKFIFFSKWGTYNPSHFINAKLDIKILISVLFLVYVNLYTIVSSFLPILLMYCGIDVNGIMLR
ncbi:MAG: hypothetical protein FWF56_04870 [Firmicutes bacterium]|nr:hypothetical protein [Bacillota bacterium]MCL1953877.1 hypothetical protein [Bacillota bacterium]